IPFGNLDEFNKKVVREDYQLQAIWDLGIKKMRIPIGDLYLTSTLDRIEDLTKLGHEFTIFTTGVPNEKTKSTIIKYKELIAAWEISLSIQDMEEAIIEVEKVKETASIKTYLSKIETSASEKPGDKATFHHFIRHGFDAKDKELISELYRNDLLNTFEG